MSLKSFWASWPARPLAALGFSVVAMAFATPAAFATDIFTENPLPAFAGPTNNPIEDYFLHWYDRVHEAQATQPHWMTPLATVTPRLEEEIRYDQSFQQLGSGAEVTNFGGGKGLEFIPTTMNEVLINIPNYEERYVKSPAYGFSDWNFLTIKQRIVSEPEDKGNYIVTTFLGFQAPLLGSPFTNKAWVITPTIAGGKGWGDFDIQATSGVAIPTANEFDDRHLARYEHRVPIPFRRIFLAGGRAQRHLLVRRRARQLDPTLRHTRHHLRTFRHRQEFESDLRLRLPGRGDPHADRLEAGAHADLRPCFSADRPVVVLGRKSGRA